MSYATEVWKKAVADAEKAVYTATYMAPALAGESAEAYAARIRVIQDEALRNLATARQALAIAQAADAEAARTKEELG